MSRNAWLTRRPVLLALVALSVLLVVAMHFTGAGAAFAGTVLQVPFDERFNGYSPDQALAVMLAMDDLQCRDYIRYRALDLLLPWTVGAFLSGSLARLAAPRLARLGWLAALVDTAENAALWGMLLGDDAAARLVPLASVLTQLKWVVYGLALGALAVLLARRCLKLKPMKGS